MKKQDKILVKYKDVFDALERYDRTGKLFISKKKKVKRKI